MAIKVYSCAEAINKLKTQYGKSEIVYITLSSNAAYEDAYGELCSLLDTTELKEGYYLIEPDSDAPLGQKVHIDFTVSASVTETPGESNESSMPDIVLTVNVKEGETIDLSAFWTMNDNSKNGANRGVVWENGLLEDSLSHTYVNAYKGEVYIYNYSLRSAVIINGSTSGTGGDVGCKYRITDIEFVKPQVIEEGRFLFGGFYDGETGTGLKTVKGTLCFAETYSTAGLQQMFYNAQCLTSLKDFTIIASSSRPTNIGVMFMNSGLNDKILQEINFVGLNKNALTSYS